MSLQKRFKAEIEKAVSILKQGGSIVYPTDTCYGIGANAENLKAVKKIYLIKKRNLYQPMHILVSCIDMAKEYVFFSKKTEIFFEKFSDKLFHKPITLVLPIKKRVPRGIKLLSAKSGFIGVRISSEIVSKEIIKKFEGPITTPSANPKGGKPPYSVNESLDRFKKEIHQPDFYIDGGILKPTLPSSIVQVKKNKVCILRRGSLSFEQILDAWDEAGSLK